MGNRVEIVCGRLISQTFKVVNPIKKKIINTNCEVHLFIQKSALDVLKEEGYEKQVQFYKSFEEYVNKFLSVIQVEDLCFNPLVFMQRNINVMRSISVIKIVMYLEIFSNFENPNLYMKYEMIVIDTIHKIMHLSRSKG